MTPPNEAEVIATFVQAILYGLYIATLAHCLRWIMYDDEGWKLRKIINWSLVGLTMLIFALSTADLGVLLQITIDDVVATDGITRTLTRLNDVIVAVEQVTYLIVNALLIHHSWEINGKDWRVISIPFVGWFASLVLALIDIVLRAIAIGKVTNTDTWTPSRFTWPWFAFIVLTVFVGLYASVIILRHFLSISDPNIKPLARLHKICLLISESGLVYTSLGVLNLVASVVVFMLNADALISITCDAVHFSAAGIAFNLLLIRIYQEIAYPKLTGTTPLPEKRRSLSALQFHAATVTTQTRSHIPIDTEHGIHTRDTRVSFVNATQ